MKTTYFIKDKRIDKIIYIGQTKNFKKRKSQHFSHTKQPVDLYMYEQGRDNFVMDKFQEYPDTMTDDELRKIEDELILKYNTIEDGLNKWRSGNIKRDNLDEYIINQRNRLRETGKLKQYSIKEEEKRKKDTKRKEYQKAYNSKEENKERRRLVNKVYYSKEENKEKHRLSNKKWYENNKEEISIKRKL